MPNLSKQIEALQKSLTFWENKINKLSAIEGYDPYIQDMLEQARWEFDKVQSSIAMLTKFQEMDRKNDE